MKVPIQFTDPDYNPYAKWRMKYLLPVYLGITAVLLGGFILAALPDDEPGVFGIVCLTLWVMATVAVLVAIPFCRKKEISWELRQYDFDWQRCPEEKVYFYQGNSFYVRFLPEVMSFNDKVYSYEDVRFQIVTYNPKQHVLIFLYISHEDGWGRVPLTPEILRMIRHFGLEIDNEEDLEYILAHPEEAFRKIYNSGSIHGIRHYLEQPPY